MGKMTENGEGRNAALVTLSERLAVACSNELCMWWQGGFCRLLRNEINNNFVRCLK